MRLAFCSLSLLFISVDVDAQPVRPSPEALVAAQVYRLCVVKKAVALEPSGADVADISSAALLACHDARDNAEAAMDADVVIADVRSGTKSPSGRVDRALVEIGRRIASEANLKVLEKRAARKK